MQTTTWLLAANALFIFFALFFNNWGLMPVLMIILGLSVVLTSLLQAVKRNGSN
jgi:hypothetical protein